MAEITTLWVALAWAAAFVLGRHLQLGASPARRNWLSIAAGISIAYVFVELLPEMSRMQALFSTAAAGRPLPFPDYRVYTAALAGFVLFHWFESRVAASRPARDEGAAGAGTTAYTPAYRLHIAGFSAYVLLMGYLIDDAAANGLRSLTLFGLSMFLHFLGVDQALRREHGFPYERRGRWILAAAIVAGWVLGILDLISNLLLPTLMGFIGGGVVINSIKEEMPEQATGRAGPFALGALGYALLLLSIQ